MAKRPRRQIQPEEASMTERPHSEMAISESNEDMISGLPNEVLTHILSFIPTKSAVATTVLSKRWDHLWTSVPNLDFGSSCTSVAYCSVKRAHFIDFVNRVLSLNNVLSVRTIYIDAYEDCELSDVCSWINSVVRRNAIEFSMRLPSSFLLESPHHDCRIYSLPGSFFNQENLVHLHIKYFALEVPSLVWFPSLKFIHLNNVQLLDNDSMKNLLSGCPVLTRLYIDRGEYDNAQKLYICSSSLHNLSLSTSYLDKDDGYDVVIDAPNLSSLHLSDEVGVNYAMINLSSLTEAYLGVEEDGRVSGDNFEERFYELLIKVSHVKEMTLHSATISSFENVSFEHLPTFNNLTSLTVEIFDDNSWSVLPYLFHCTPILVTFSLEIGNVLPYCAWNNPDVVPRCFVSCIENVKISSFGESDEEMGMIAYILKNAMVLKMLSILSLGLDLVQETNILKTLLTLPRSSSACQVEYENI